MQITTRTESILADREDIWMIANFDGNLTGILKLYTNQGDIFDTNMANEIIMPKESSQKMIFGIGKGKLHAGEKMIAKLHLSDDNSKQSDAKVIQVVSEKQKPTVHILDNMVTKGIPN